MITVNNPPVIPSFEETGTGDVVGPASAVADNLVGFNSTTGKLIKDLGIDPRYIIDPSKVDINGGSFMEAGVVPWGAIVGGDGAASSNVNGFFDFAGHPGIARFQTGTTNTGYAGLVGQYGFIGNGWRYKTCIRLLNLSTALEEFAFFAGWCNTNNGAAAANAIYFSYDRTVSTFWRCHTLSSAASETITTTDVAVVEDAFIDLEIVMNAARTSVAFYINGVLKATHTTNIMTTAAGGYTQAKIVKSVGTTTRDVYVDYMYDWHFKP